MFVVLKKDDTFTLWPLPQSSGPVCSGAVCREAPIVAAVVRHLLGHLRERAAVVRNTHTIREIVGRWQELFCTQSNTKPGGNTNGMSAHRSTLMIFDPVSDHRVGVISVEQTSSPPATGTK